MLIRGDSFSVFKELYKSRTKNGSCVNITPVELIDKCGLSCFQRAHDVALLIFLIHARWMAQHTVIWEIFVVKKFRARQRVRKLNTKYFQHTYYIIECELNYRRVQKFFNTNILHMNIFNTKIFQMMVHCKKKCHRFARW